MMSTAFTRPSPSRCRHLRGGLEDREDRAFRGELVADVRGHLDSGEPTAHLRERRGEAAGVARPHDAFELHLLDPGEEPDPLAVVGEGHRAHGRSLGHALGEDHAGHDRVPREMALQVPLLAGEVVLCDAAHARLELGDAVDEEERVAVWDEPLDARPVEDDAHAVSASMPTVSMRCVVTCPALNASLARIFLCASMFVVTPTTVNSSSARCIRATASGRSLPHAMTFASSES